MLRESWLDEEDVDLNNVELSHYRLAMIRQQDLSLREEGASYLVPGEGLGTAKAKDKKKNFSLRLSAV
jgi:type I restriction enzyme R subunit